MNPMYIELYRKGLIDLDPNMYEVTKYLRQKVMPQETKGKIVKGLLTNASNAVSTRGCI